MTFLLGFFVGLDVEVDEISLTTGAEALIDADVDEDCAIDEDEELDDEFDDEFLLEFPRVASDIESILGRDEDFERVEEEEVLFEDLDDDRDRVEDFDEEVKAFPFL